MPSPRRSRELSKSEKKSLVKARTVDCRPQVNPASSGQTTDVTISVPPGTQLKLFFSGIADIRVGEMQLSLPGIGTPPYEPDTLTLCFARSARGPIRDTRSPEARIREFEREEYRVDPYVPEYASWCYPTRKAV